MLALRTPLLTAAVFLAAIANGITFPLIAAAVEATGVSGTWIGINGAMPALGWILASILVPQLQVRLGLPFRRVLQLFLASAITTFAAMRFADSYLAMTVLRFFYGGAMGIVFRCMEYWINSVSVASERGRNLGTYNVLFMIALIIGSVLQPEIGSRGWYAFAPPLMLAGCGFVLLLAWSGEPNAVIEIAPPPAAVSTARAMPIALLAVLVYGAYESAPIMMLQVYAVKNSVDSATAAYVLAAAALGNIVMQYPIAALSDRIGRLRPLLLCLSASSVAAAALPFSLGNPAAFLTLCAVLGGAAGAVYSTALAMVGDQFDGARLVVANAAFGAFYAVSSAIGPLIDGFAIDQFRTHGLVIWLAAIFGIAAAVAAASGLGASQPQVLPREPGP